MATRESDCAVPVGSSLSSLKVSPLNLAAFNIREPILRRLKSCSDPENGVNCVSVPSSHVRTVPALIKSWENVLETNCIAQIEQVTSGKLSKSEPDYIVIRTKMRVS